LAQSAMASIKISLSVVSILFENEFGKTDNNFKSYN
jgi:hypothetical protein